MTWVFQEGDLQFTVSNAEEARRFDDPTTHGVGFMKAVDFVVELRGRYLFVEFKDPQDPNTPQVGLETFIENFQNERLDSDLGYKYRDSFLYEWAAGRDGRDSYYIVLIGVDSLTTADLDKRTKDLERKLPVGKPDSWIRPIVAGCGVFNLASWNERFPNFQVRRLSSLQQSGG